MSNQPTESDSNGSDREYQEEDYQLSDEREKKEKDRTEPFNRFLSRYNKLTTMGLTTVEGGTEVTRKKLKKDLKDLKAEEFIAKYVKPDRTTLIRILTLFRKDIPQRILELEDSDLLSLTLSTLIDNKKKVRQKLSHINTIEDCVNLIKNSKKIMVLTGAGVSVSCGIPDFRSENGIYSRLTEFKLSDPQEMFCLSHFKTDPECFYSFAKEIYPSNFQPSPSHRFVKLLEDQGKLLRNYTQNIDTLEQVAGIKNVIQCHGSFATASCIRCRYSFPGDYIEHDVLNQKVPYCPLCQDCSNSDNSEDSVDFSVPSILKPDIVFFGEGLPESYNRNLELDQTQVDLLIVMGTSLKVLPVSNIPTLLPQNVPTILINRTPNPAVEFDVQLIGYSDAVVKELCQRLGWQLPEVPPSTDESDSGITVPPTLPSHWHLFSGAQLGDLADPSDSSTTDHSNLGSPLSSSPSLPPMDKLSAHSPPPTNPDPPPQATPTDPPPIPATTSHKRSPSPLPSSATPSSVADPEPPRKLSRP